jgi:Protein of unknown function (DUF3180)
VSRDPVPDDLDPDLERGPGGGPSGDRPPGRLRTTDLRVLVVLGLVGLVLGWGLRLLSVQLGFAVPRTGWVQVGVLVLVAAVLGSVASATRRERPAPHHAVNRLVLAKACALVAAFMTGGYLGIALSWVGIDAETASSRIGTSLVAAVAAAVAVGASLALERACRIKGGPDET